MCGPCWARHRSGQLDAEDVDGDGRPEIVVSLFNATRDGRWHVQVLEGMTGRIKADLPDRYLSGLRDVDGDGAAFEHSPRAVLEAHRRHGMQGQLALVEEQFTPVGRPGLQNRRHGARAPPHRDRRRDVVLEQLPELAPTRGDFLPDHVLDRRGPGGSSDSRRHVNVVWTRGQPRRHMRCVKGY